MKYIKEKNYAIVTLTLKEVTRQISLRKVQLNSATLLLTQSKADADHFIVSLHWAPHLS